MPIIELSSSTSKLKNLKSNPNNKILQNNKMKNKDTSFQVSFTFAHHTVYQISQIIYMQSHTYFKNY